MKLRIKLGLSLLALAGMFASAAHAQAWKPSGPVTLVLPYGAGGSLDIFGRPLARELESIWGQPVVVENISGGESLIGTNKVTNAPADGKTLLLQISSMVLTKHLPGLKGVDPISNLDTVAAFGKTPIALYASKHTQGNTLREVIEACRKATPPCSMAGNGTLTRIGSKHFARAADVPNLTTVMYRTSPQWLVDLIGGRLTMAFGAPSTVVSQQDSIKILAVAAPNRLKMWPDVPTTSEAGLPGYQYQIWWTIFVRKGTPPNIVNDISAAVKRAAEQPSVQKALALTGSEPMWAGPREAARLMQEQANYFDGLVKISPLE